MTRQSDDKSLKYGEDLIAHHGQVADCVACPSLEQEKGITITPCQMDDSGDEVIEDFLDWADSLPSEPDEEEPNE